MELLWNKVYSRLSCGSLDPKLSPDIIDDLIYVVLHKKPIDFEFIGHTWTCGLLVLYIKQTYAIEVSTSTVWSILKKNNLSHKRAQAKPTKANKSEQEALKKMLETIDILEYSSDTVVYALDETSIRIESNKQ